MSKLEFNLKKVISFLSIAVLVLPFFNLQNTYYPNLFAKAIAFQIIVEIMLVCWVFLIINNNKYLLNWKHPVFIFSTLFIFLLSITVFFSQDPFVSFWSYQSIMTGLFQYWHFYLWFVIFSSTFKKFDEVLFFLKITVLVAIFVSMYAIVEWIGSHGERPNSVLGNPILFSEYAVTHICFALILWKKTSARLWKYIAFFSSQLFIVVIILSGSRSGLLALLILLPCVLLIIDIKLRSKFILSSRSIFRSRKGFLSLLVLLLICGVISILGYRYKDLLTSYLPSSVQHLFDFNNKNRLDVWKIALKAGFAHPVFGWGMENFDIPYNHYVDSRVNISLIESWFIKSHNQFLEFFSTSGIVGLSSYLLLIGSVFYVMYKMYKKQINSTSKVILLFLGLSVALQLIQDFFIYQFFWTNVMLFFVFAICMILTSDTTSATKQQNCVLSNKVSAVLYTFTIFFGCFVLFFGMRQLGWIQKDMFSTTTISSIDSGSFDQALKKLIMFTNGDSPYKKDMVLHTCDALKNFEAINGADDNSFVSLLKQTIVESDAQYEQHKKNAMFAMLSAWLHAKNDQLRKSDIDTSIYYQNQAMILAPNSVPMRQLIWQLAFIKKDYQKALNGMIQDDLEKNDPQASYLVSAAYAGTGNFIEASNAFERGVSQHVKNIYWLSTFQGVEDGLSTNTKIPDDLVNYLIKQEKTLYNHKPTVDKAVHIFTLLDLKEARDIALQHLSAFQ